MHCWNRGVLVRGSVCGVLDGTLYVMDGERTRTFEQRERGSDGSLSYVGR